MLIVTPTKCRVERQGSLENWQKCQWLSPRALDVARAMAANITPGNPAAH